MKRIITFCISLVLVACTMFAVSCKKPDTDSSEGEYVEGVTVDKDYVYYGDSRNGKKQIRITFVEKGYGRLWLVETAKYFVKANPDYYVFIDGDPNLTGSISTKLKSGRNLSDIYMPVGSMWEQYVLSGYVEPIGDVYSAKAEDSDDKTILQKMSESWQNYGKIKNDVYDDYFVMPWNDNVTGFVYNVSMFEKYGWSVPKTTDELYALCERILSDTKGAIKPFVYPGLIGGYFDFIGGTWWMQSSGYEGMREFYDFESVDVFDPSVQPSLGRKRSYVEFERFFAGDASRFSMSGSMSKNHITAQMDFLRGNAAMIPNASWMEREMIDTMPKDFKMAIMSVPYVSSAQKDENGNFIQCNYMTAPDYMFIPKGAKEVVGAKEFLKFMCRDDMLRLYTKYAGSPRPFDYDTDGIEGLSFFTQSVLDLWKSSRKFFIYSKHPAYIKSLISLNGGYMDPYASIIYGDLTSTKFLNAVYLNATENWDQWMEDANV